MSVSMEPGIKQLIFFKKPDVVLTRATFTVGGGPNFTLRAEYAAKMLHLGDVVMDAMKQLIKRENGGRLGAFDAINPFNGCSGACDIADGLVGSGNGKCALMALRDVIAPHVADECWGIPAEWHGEWRAEKVFCVKLAPGEGPSWFCGLKIMKDGA
ncbi:hypothetical protein AB1Y20_023099 [Prymnesium parvum]|uniref:Uncharacterized protein n=1 Tax=Prymnesium parvum TaxID=97485 RepID=A0AB34JC59_PRYPA